MRLPSLENGSEHWVSRNAWWAVPESTHPLALPSCSGFGLDLVAFRPFEGLLQFKGILGSRASQLTKHKLPPAGRGCPWHQTMLAAGEHPSPIWGFKPPFRHLRSDFILQNVVACVPLTAKLLALLEL